MDEKIIRTVAKFYEVRDNLRYAFPDSYAKSIETVGVILYGSMRKLRTDNPMDAVLPLLKEAVDKGSGSHALWFMAAAVEWSEGNLTATKQGWPTEIVYKPAAQAKDSPRGRKGTEGAKHGL